MNKAKDLLFKLCRRLKCNALFAALFTALLLLPDRLFEIANPRLDYSFDPAFVFTLAVFGFCLSLCGRTVGLTVLAAFGLMQFIQLSHIAYFGRPINPVDVAKIYDEFSDVREAGIGAWRDVWFVAPLVLLTFGYLARFLVKHRKILGFSWFAVIAVVIALGVKPERAARKSLKHFLPAASRYSVHNSLNTFSFFLVKGHNIEPTQSIMPEKFYVPYAARPTNAATPDVIVFVMGESTNTAQMSLFGTQAQTTPFLDSLKSDKRFLYKKAIAGAVSTHSSLPVFFNLLNEPANMEQLAAQTSNLFKLAKQAGYKTYWLSAQDAKNTNDIGTAHIDELITKEENPVAFAAGQEDYLLQLFKETDTTHGKHFIVLHFRTMHDPFEKNYEHHPEFDAFKPATHKRADRTRAAYRNAAVHGRRFAPPVRHLQRKNGGQKRDSRVHVRSRSTAGRRRAVRSQQDAFVRRRRAVFRLCRRPRTARPALERRCVPLRNRDVAGARFGIRNHQSEQAKRRFFHSRQQFLSGNGLHGCQTDGKRRSARVLRHFAQVFGIVLSAENGALRVQSRFLSERKPSGSPYKFIYALKNGEKP